MNHLLSLEFGKNLPLGLSGGATPSAKSDPSFAALLGGPLAKAAPLAQDVKGLVVQAPLPPGGKFAALTGTMIAGLQPSDRGIPSLPQAMEPVQADASAETGMATALNVAPFDDLAPTLAAAPVPADTQVAGETEPALANASTQSPDSTAPLPPEPVELVRAPVTREAEPQGEPSAKPSREKLRPELAIDTPHSSLAVNRGDAPLDGPLAMAQPGENHFDSPTEIAAPDSQQTITIPVMSQTAPPPVNPIQRPFNAAAAEGARAKGSSQRDAQAVTGPKEIAQGGDASALRSATDSAGSANAPPAPNNSTTVPGTGTGTGDFASMIEGTRAEPIAPAFDSSSPAAEILSQTRADPVRSQAGPSGTPGPLPATISARQGEIGHQLGVEIVRHGVDGRDSLTIRLDPVEMGEIQIRLQFDERGTMRAHILAESGTALEMLRRDSADLVRALGDAGVRTDAQSFQFESRGQGRGDQQGQHGRPETQQGQHAGNADADDGDPSPQPKARADGILDLFA